MAVFDLVPKVEKTYRAGPPSPKSAPDEEDPTSVPASPAGAAASFLPATDPDPPPSSPPAPDPLPLLEADEVPAPLLPELGAPPDPLLAELGAATDPPLPEPAGPLLEEPVGALLEEPAGALLLELPLPLPAGPWSLLELLPPGTCAVEPPAASFEVPFWDPQAGCTATRTYSRAAICQSNFISCSRKRGFK